MRVATARAHWARLVGADIARHTAVLDLSDGWMTVGVPNAAVESRLERQRETLFQALSTLPDGTRVRGLTFRRATMDAIRAAAPSQEGKRGLRPLRGPLDEGLLTERQRAALDGAGDETLRTAFAAWMIRHSERKGGR